MVRSPCALRRIAEIGVRAPARRTQPPVSKPSAARPLITRSPIASSPAGPPIGPAKATRAPRRAIATAALAALPPPTAKNSVASALVSGAGNSRTWKTSSSTAIPAQRMCGMSDEAPVRFDPGADDVMGDGDRVSHRQAVGMPAQQHRDDLVAGEPARVLELGAID